MVRKIVIDTDTAQDDCVAILLGLFDQEADVRAITMVAGNVGFDRQVKNAFMTLNVAGKLGTVPIFLGCTRPLVRDWVSAENVHGDGSGGIDMDFSGCDPEAEHGVDALIRLAREHKHELDIVAIGPLTNIAMAAVKDTEFASNVRSLTIMGGSNNARGNITAAAEFNFYVDPEAAEVVFRAGFAITVVPWAPLTLNDAVFTRKNIADITALGTPLSTFFWHICETTLEFDESVGIEGSTHPDSLALAVLLHPELVLEKSEYAVSIETSSELTRGYSAMSWGVHDLEPNATVIEKVDAGAFYRLIVEMLSNRTEPNRVFSASWGKF